MSGSVNKVILIGNLGANPEVRNFNNGGKVCSLRIATSENWKDRNTGERRERTEWHTVDIFNEGLITVAENYLHKGSKVYIEGQLQTRKWQDQSGNDRYSTSVVLQGFSATLTMLDSANGGNRDGQSGGYGNNDRGGSGGYGSQGGSSGGYGNNNDNDRGRQAPEGYGNQNQGGSSGGYGGSSSRDLDDEIPF